MVTKSGMPFLPPFKDQSGVSAPQGKSMAKEVEEHFLEGQKVMAFYQALGINPAWSTAATQHQQAPVKAEEKSSTSVDLGTVFKAVTDQNANMMNHVLTLSQQSKSAQSDPFMQYLISELAEMKRELLASRTNPQSSDPFKAIEDYGKRYVGLMDELKKGLGYPATGQTGSPSDATAIQLKGLELQQRDRELQFKAQEHQWEVEKEDRQENRREDARRFDMAHQLKVREIDEKKERSDNFGGLLQDIAAAVMGAVEPSGNAPMMNVAAQPAREPPPIEQPVYRVSSIPCLNAECGQRIEIPRGASKVVCPNCQTGYELEVPGQPTGREDLPTTEEPTIGVMAP